jgi:hypothetical protein
MINLRWVKKCRNQELGGVAVSLLNLTSGVERKPGEKLTLPAFLINAVDAGRWLIAMRPSRQRSCPLSRLRVTMRMPTDVSPAD